MVDMIHIHHHHHHPPLAMATMIGTVIDDTEMTMNIVGEVIWICVGKGNT